MNGATPRVWLITGASRGLGDALTRSVLAHGDIAVAAARSQPTLDTSRQAQSDPRLMNVQLDVLSPDSVARAVQAIVDRFGRIDVVVNNAGRHLRGAVEEISDEEARALFDVNFFGALNVLREALPVLRAQRSGSVILIGSKSGYSGAAGAGLYSASKFALEGLGQSLAAELAAFGINCTTVAPGALRTELLSPDSMVSAAKIIDDYATGPAGSALTAALHRADGRQAGDPRRAAEVIYEAATSTSPPLHLPLGSDAIESWETRITARNAELENWRNRAGDIALTED